jgi:hypothetical protein
MLCFDAPAGRPPPLLSNAATEALIASARHELFKLLKKALSCSEDIEARRIDSVVTLGPSTLPLCADAPLAVQRCAGRAGRTGIQGNARHYPLSLAACTH